MGSRGRSVRLTISFLVAIPLITMLGLFADVAYTSVTNWLNLDRAPSLIKTTSEPLTSFVSLLQAERRAAVVYLSDPGAANLGAYDTAITATKAGEVALLTAINSAGTRSSASPAESAAITQMISDVNGMTGLRGEVSAGQLSPLTALGAYTKIITDQSAVFQAEADSMTEAAASSQGLGLIATVNTREDLDEQDAVLAGALVSGTLTPADRVVFDQAAGRQQDDTLLYTALFTPAELHAFNTTLDSLAPQTLQNDLTTVQQAVEGGATLGQLEQQGLSPAAWQQLTAAIAKANYQAGLVAANAELANVQQLASNAKKQVWETAAVGLAGLILTLLVTGLLGRSLNRRLTSLRRSALTLAEVQLPAVVGRLRRGESVDVAAEAPPLRAGRDEIGQVGQAIDTVRQTAIRSAVEEARLRQGLNDVFRNLARRNQSLLQRQLAVLDEAERRATDPDVLEDLFKMDHLTTRMRRHAEGLIILSGAQPGRGWSAPVRLIDVMRGAVAEVEDYARVTVGTQSTAALAGPAVTDVIHLLAELIENATALSPPFTQVRVSGEPVGNGFAIEIEDRGLGLTTQRLAELNERLANPPDINPANTEQLGLFVVGQLARRHGISVTLRPSPYGGTTAVTLIPLRLIVDEGPAAITAGGHGTAATPASPAVAGVNGGGGHGGGYGGPNGSSGPYRPAYGSAASPPRLDTRTMPDALGGYSGTAPGGSTAGTGPGIRISGAVRQSAANGGRRGRHGAAEARAVTGLPVSRPAPSGFDVFTPLRKPDPSTVAAPDDPADAPYAESYADYGGGSAGTGSHDTGSDDTSSHDTGSHDTGSFGSASDGDSDYRDGSYGNNPGNDGGYEQGNLDESGSGDYKGLPRRVRQANLAPQLRSSATAGAGPASPAGVPLATAASLTDMRNTLSAMQRGWQQGRAESERDTEASADGD